MEYLPLFFAFIVLLINLYVISQIVHTRKQVDKNYLLIRELVGRMDKAIIEKSSDVDQKFNSSIHDVWDKINSDN